MAVKQTVTLLTLKQKIFFYSFLWIMGLLPLSYIAIKVLTWEEANLPPVTLLDNPPEYQASLLIAKKNGDEDIVIGRFYSKANRTSVKYREISPHVIDALISTEDERFFKHSGTDLRALGRATFGFIGKQLFGTSEKGGASTLTQQLAKNLYPDEERQKDTKSFSKMYGFLIIKLKENIIANRLEQRYTKEEIITLYLNQVDFLHLAVGIKSAANIYFNKEPIDLNKIEAATIVGMCKNPSLYNPLTYKIKDYRGSIAHKKKIKLNQVSLKEIKASRKADSLMVVKRRNQVLYQWLKNSQNGNKSLKSFLTKKEYDSLRKIPIKIDYTPSNHRTGIAPYFRSHVKKEVQALLSKKINGKYMISKRDGSPYNIYKDGLKIYTTLDVDLQKHAEYAVQRHLSDNLQELFDKNNKNLKNAPFSNNTKEKVINALLNGAKKQSKRYKSCKKSGYSESEIDENFNTPVKMKVFSWKGLTWKNEKGEKDEKGEIGDILEIDTIMTPMDSIKYYKSFLHAGLVSIDPHTGFIKAWVGGANFKHFEFDHIRSKQGRQVGSTIKPFVYGMALENDKNILCKEFSEKDYEYITYGANGKQYGKPYKFNLKAEKTFEDGLAKSNNPATLAVLNSMGAFNPSLRSGGPFLIASLLKQLNINLPNEKIVPSMVLGTMELNLLKITAAQCVFPNNGKFVYPTVIERIEDRNGRIIYSAEYKVNHALTSSGAYKTLECMKNVITRGTGAALRSRNYSWGGITAPTAGKTGTTDDNADGWFMGITPDLVTGVWVGAENKQIRWKYTNQGQGARTAMPIYGYYMQKVYADTKIGFSKDDFVKPDDYDENWFKCDDEEEELELDNLLN